MQPDSSIALPTGPLAQLERPPILVVGDVHSGATWVSDVLSADPRVAALTELRLFSGLGLEPPFRDSHWNPESSERMFDRRMGLGQFLPKERVTADLRALSDRWLARALLPEHRFLVERSPVGAPGVNAFAQLYPEGSVIFVMRDGREVARSLIAEQERRRKPAGDGPEPPAPWRMLWSLSNSWSAHVKAMREAAKTTPVAVHEVRYEDIRARPRDTARALFELAGIPCDEQLLGQIIDRTAVPGDAGLGEWSRLERALYGAGAGELLHELGYTPAPAPGVLLLRQALLAYGRVKSVI
jgi:hypothetical protein